MKNNKNQTWNALELAWNLGFQIAVPLVVFALVGRYLDRVFTSTPWLFLFGILIAIITSTILIYRKVTNILKDIDTKKE